MRYENWRKSGEDVILRFEIATVPEIQRFSNLGSGTAGNKGLSEINENKRAAPELF